MCVNESKIAYCMNWLNCIYFVRAHSRPVGRLPLPTTTTTTNTTSPRPKSGPSSPNSSGLPTPPQQGQERKEQRSISSIQTYRWEQHVPSLLLSGDGSTVVPILLRTT